MRLGSSLDFAKIHNIFENYHPRWGDYCIMPWDSCIIVISWSILFFILHRLKYFYFFQILFNHLYEKNDNQVVIPKTDEIKVFFFYYIFL